MSRPTGRGAAAYAGIDVLLFLFPLLGFACSGGGSVGGGGGGGGGGGNGGGAPQNPLTVSAVAPDTGLSAGGLAVTVTGTGFTASPSVSVEFGAFLAEDVVVVNDTELTCTTPASGVGMVNVRVAGGGFTAVLQDAFEYMELATRADLNGDGFADFIVGANKTDVPWRDAGSVCVFFGDGSLPSDRISSEADVQILGSAPGAELGYAIAAGDIDGDGIDDLIIGAPGLDHGWIDDGGVYVFLGPLSQGGPLSASAADLALFAETGTTADFFGNRVLAEDVDGDGIDDLVVGAMRHDGAGSLAGAIYVFSGGPEISAATTDGAIKFTGTSNNGRFGADIAVSDIDGDTVADLVVGAPFHGSLRGAASVYLGPITAGGAADMTFEGDASGDRFGSAVELGDVDGDGTDDLVVAAPGADAPGDSQGAVSIWFGGPGLIGGSASTADVTLSGAGAGDEFGADLVVGDLDGDAVADVLVGAQKVDAVLSNVGAVYAFFGWAGFSSAGAAAADVTLVGETISGGSFGAILQLLDVDGDATADLCASAFGVGSGQVHVFRGGPGLSSGSATNDDLTLRGEVAGAQFGFAVVSDR